MSTKSAIYVLTHLGSISYSDLIITIGVVICVPMLTYVTIFTVKNSVKFDMRLKFLEDSFRETITAIKEMIKGFGHRVDRIEDGIVHYREEVRKDIHAIEVSISEIAPALKERESGIAARTRDKIIENGIRIWREGEKLIKEFIVENHKKFLGKPHEYKGAVYQLGMDKLRHETRYTVEKFGPLAQTFDDAVNAEILEPFINDLMLYIDGIAKEKDIPSDMPIKIKTIFAQYIADWVETFKRHHGPGERIK